MVPLAEVGKAQGQALVAALRACPLDATNQRLEDCHLLSPAYTGTGYARRVLQRLVVLPQGRHSSTLESVRASNNSARCFVMTLRDPLDRIESGVRYRLMTNATWNSSSTSVAMSRKMYEVARQLPSADALVAAWRRTDHPFHDFAAQLALSSNPPRMQADMLRGHVCGKTAVRVLCTNSLPSDLQRLGLDFGRQLHIKPNTPRPRSEDALVHSVDMRRWFSCHAAAADTWLFHGMCGGMEGGRNPCQ